MRSVLLAMSLIAGILVASCDAGLIEYQISGELFPTLSSKDIGGPFTGSMIFDEDEPATAFHLLIIPSVGEPLEADFSMVNNLWDGFGEVDIRQFAAVDESQSAVFQMTAWDNDPALIFDASVYGDDNNNGDWDNWQFHWELGNPLGISPISGSISSIDGPAPLVNEPRSWALALIGGVVAFFTVARRHA